mgnify:CR=1 FL=1
MVDLLLKNKFALERRTESKEPSKRTLLSKIILNGLKLVDTYLIFYIMYLKKFLGYSNVEPLEDSEELPIVSITTFPLRTKHFWITLYFIFMQTIRPGKIIVVLSKEEFPNGIKSLPKSMLYYCDKGVEYCFVDYNLRPHNKYYYAMQNYSQRIIVTLDDDLLYYSDTIERLLRIHKKCPNSVCSNRVTKMIIDKDNPGSINKWHLTFIEHGPSSSLLALGYSGILYPPQWCGNDVLFDKDLINDLSLHADDLWLKAVELINGVDVASGDYYAHPVTLPSSQKIALQKTNARKSNPRNETIWNNLVKYFSLNDYIK